MRRRLLVAKAMIHAPLVLVLDEPTAGVDIDLRRKLWTYVRAMNARGTTVLLTTHYLEEAQALCDRIAIINHGRLIACDTTDALLRRLDTKQMAVTLSADIDAVPGELRSFNVELRDARQLVFHYPPSKTHSGEILAAVQRAGLTVIDLVTREADLEDIFLRLTAEDAG
jgi:ABC-2 type transport system ATP-binding protein